MDQSGTVSQRGEPDAQAPLVSVIIPAHNAAAYLGDALESLRRQTIESFEAIVVDDGSTDATAAIAESFAERDSRFRLIRQDRPSGKPACARNVALRAARGEYVAFLDSDDIALPTRLESSLAAVRNTGASLAFGEFRKFWHQDGEHFPEGHLQSLDFVERAAPYLERASNGVYRCRDGFVAFMLTDMIAVNTPTFFARRRDLLDAGIFDESLVGGEDLDLFFRMVARHPVVYVDQVQTLVRVHESSLTATQTERCIVDAIDVRRHHFRRVVPLMSADQVRGARAAIAESLFDLGYGRWTAGANRLARAAFRESWRIMPRWLAIAAYLKAWIPHRVVRPVSRIARRLPA